MTDEPSFHFANRAVVRLVNLDRLHQQPIQVRSVTALDYDRELRNPRCLASPQRFLRLAVVEVFPKAADDPNLTGQVVSSLSPPRTDPEKVICVATFTELQQPRPDIGITDFVSGNVVGLVNTALPLIVLFPRFDPPKQDQIAIVEDRIHKLFPFLK